jgi:hypothetical protein
MSRLTLPRLQKMRTVIERVEFQPLHALTYAKSIDQERD